jgi:hypothetical protein
MAGVGLVVVGGVAEEGRAIDNLVAGFDNGGGVEEERKEVVEGKVDDDDVDVDVDVDDFGVRLDADRDGPSLEATIADLLRYRLYSYFAAGTTRQESRRGG